jgi:MFS family permease
MPEDRSRRSLPAQLVHQAQLFLPDTPFGRLVRTHLVAMCADACVAVSLAGSLFFQKPSSGARGSILLYLLLTMLPFAIVAPIIGPALDRLRGGRRLLVVGSCVGRAVLCFAMAFVVTKPSPEGLLVYPFAFGILVLSKGYSVARSSLVPALVEDNTALVKANSRLALISAIAAGVGGALAAGVGYLFGADWSVRLAMIVFLVAALYALRIPRTQVVIAKDEAKLEKDELHQPSILLAGSAMAILRGSVGFLQFFAAFTFKSNVVALGVVASGAFIGLFAGNLLAPRVRLRVREEYMLVGALLLAATAVLLGALSTGVFGVALAFLAVAFSAAAGKLGFDSLLQRDGPDAVRGRAFARFETRFQAAWVVGALLGIVPVAVTAGLGVLGLVLGFGGVSYFAALRAAGTRPPRSKLRPEAVDRALERARDNLRDRRSQTRSGRRRAAAKARRRTKKPRAPDEGPPPPKRPPRRPSAQPGAAPPPNGPPGRSTAQPGATAPPPRRRRSGAS